MDCPTKRAESCKRSQNSAEPSAIHELLLDAYDERKGIVDRFVPQTRPKEPGRHERDPAQREHRSNGLLAAPDAARKEKSLNDKRKGILDGLPASDLQKSIESFSKQHKIDIRQSNGMLDYTLDVNGRTRFLFKTDASEYGLRDAALRLNTLVSTRQRELESQYGVRFATPGEVVDYQRNPSNPNGKQVLIQAVNPELYQVEGIGSALDRGIPTSITDVTTGGKDVKIYFLSDKISPDRSGSASYQLDRTGTPSVFFNPSINKISKATEFDLSASEYRKSYADPTRPETIESITLHQLGRHQFWKQGLRNSAEGEVLQSNMGWVRNRDWNNPRPEWLLLGKKSDTDGSNASYLPYKDSTSGDTVWARWKPDGGAVDSRGRRVPPVQSERIDSAEARQQALVKPPSLSFNTPEEEYAEALKMHRLGEASRRELIKTSPYLYDIIKSSDQKEIDSKYGKQADGSSRYIRAADGDLVDNDDVNRLQIQTFEVLSMYPSIKARP